MSNINHSSSIYDNNNNNSNNDDSIAIDDEIIEGKRSRSEDLISSRSDHSCSEPSSKIPRKIKTLHQRQLTKTRSSQEKVSNISQHEQHVAPSIREYLSPGGYKRYYPRPEWIEFDRSTIAVVGGVNNTAAFTATIVSSNQQYINNNSQQLSSTNTRRRSTSGAVAAVFGKDHDTALHMAIRENSTHAAIELIHLISSRHYLSIMCNNKGVTPLILAAQKGNIQIVRELLRRGVDPTIASTNGATAVLQAAHFGHAHVLHFLLQTTGPTLVEQANHNSTTPLMRASQEGHTDAVRLLLQYGAAVNRKNLTQMTPLMLAAQRGHVGVCQVLIRAGAELNAKTDSQATALQLACKRGNVGVVRCLVTAGCDLWITDSRRRTARQTVIRRYNNTTNHHRNQNHNNRMDEDNDDNNINLDDDGNGENDVVVGDNNGDTNSTNNNSVTATIQELLDLLDPAVQIDLMQREARRERSFAMIRMYTLLQQRRATAPMLYDSVPLSMSHLQPHLACHDSSMQALVRTMSLPAPLVENIVRFIPMPDLWSKRIGLLQSTCFINANAAVLSALDLMDEVLEDGGFLEACDVAHIPPPNQFESWQSWRRQKQSDIVADTSDLVRVNAANVSTTDVPSPNNQLYPSILELRRKAGYLPLLAQHASTLVPVLLAPPYNMPSAFLDQLIRMADMASLIRRMRYNGVLLEATVAMDTILITNRLMSWCWRSSRRNHLQRNDHHRHNNNHHLRQIVNRINQEQQQQQQQQHPYHHPGHHQLTASSRPMFR